ncbi:AraC family transcriptional regulator [Marinoscillum furvescens]|uniref:AraC-like DNA-binding protein n=1 Tax=Marinoscillum furvescens DSM 4134 TaxID=1122208 RepID=A0A3D9L7N5_MARFU|nr:helix-turn-helix domain-containing protein [Marinoscillum furvescens]REE02092.1 AraC-like DNA-binding protein [Marinoscillum furvescens DSM 4134]
MIFPQLASKSTPVASINQFHYAGQPKRVALFPDNYVELLLCTGSPITRRMIGSVRELTLDTGQVMISACRSKGVILYAENLSYVSVKVHPELSRMVFGDNELEERDLIHILDLQLKDAGELQRFTVELVADSTLAEDAVIQQAVFYARDTRGEIKVKELLTLLEVSKSFLEQHFFKHVGLTPKEFCKVEKMQNFINYYRQYQDTLNLTQLTFKSGYYDQSHLIKDFRYFMDSRPRDFIKTYGFTL